MDVSNLQKGYLNIMKSYAILIKISTEFFTELDNLILIFYGTVKSHSIFELSRVLHSTRHHFLLESYNHVNMKFWHREPNRTKWKQNITPENLWTNPPLQAISHEQCFLHLGLQRLNTLLQEYLGLQAWVTPISRDCIQKL